MKKELDDALCAQYPLIFKDRNADMQITAMCWGFDCGDGWYNILNVLCIHLYSDYKEAKRAYDRIKERIDQPIWDGSDTIVTQAKIDEAKAELDQETLRIPVATQVKEKFGGLRFYVSGASEKHYNYIDFAESMSIHTCEECGAFGKLYFDGWHRTLCDVHAQQEERKPTDDNNH